MQRSIMYVGLDGPLLGRRGFDMEKRLAEDLDAFHLSTGRGHWMGECEGSWRVEVVHTDSIEQTPEDVRSLADALEEELNQDYVMVTVDEVEVR